MQPKILYLLQAKTGQSHTMCTLSSFSYLHSRHSCHSVCPSLCKCALRLVWPVKHYKANLAQFCMTLRAHATFKICVYPLSTFSTFLTWQCWKWIFRTTVRPHKEVHEDGGHDDAQELPVHT
jgi:hypothetical protein